MLNRRGYGGPVEQVKKAPVDASLIDAIARRHTAAQAARNPKEQGAETARENARIFREALKHASK